MWGTEHEEHGAERGVCGEVQTQGLYGLAVQRGRLCGGQESSRHVPKNGLKSDQESGPEGTGR